MPPQIYPNPVQTESTRNFLAPWSAQFLYRVSGLVWLESLGGSRTIIFRGKRMKIRINTDCSGLL